MVRGGLRGGGVAAQRVVEFECAHFSLACILIRKTMAEGTVHVPVSPNLCGWSPRAPVLYDDDAGGREAVAGVRLERARGGVDGAVWAAS